MMNNQPFDNQLQMFGQMAQQNGVSGASYIDVDPARHATNDGVRSQLPQANQASRFGILSPYLFYLVHT